MVSLSLSSSSSSSASHPQTHPHPAPHPLHHHHIRGTPASQATFTPHLHHIHPHPHPYHTTPKLSNHTAQHQCLTAHSNTYGLETKMLRRIARGSLTSPVEASTGRWDASPPVSSASSCALHGGVRTRNDSASRGHVRCDLKSVPCSCLSSKSEWRLSESVRAGSSNLVSAFDVLSWRVSRSEGAEVQGMLRPRRETFRKDDLHDREVHCFHHQGKGKLHVLMSPEDFSFMNKSKGTSYQDCGFAKGSPIPG